MDGGFQRMLTLVLANDGTLWEIEPSDKGAKWTQVPELPQPEPLARTCPLHGLEIVENRCEECDAERERSRGLDRTAQGWPDEGRCSHGFLLSESYCPSCRAGRIQGGGGAEPSERAEPAPAAPAVAKKKARKRA